MIYTAEISSIIIQVLFFWLISTLFSKKKKNGGKKNLSQLKSLFKDNTPLHSLIKKFNQKINSLNELKIVSEEPIHPHPESIPKASKKNKSKKHQIIKKEKNDEISLNPRTNKRKKFGLHSRLNLKNAIILNEIIGKPVSLRK